MNDDSLRNFEGVVRDYGYYSSAALLFKYLDLIRELKNHDPQASTRHSLRVMHSYAILKDHFAQPAPEMVHEHLKNIQTELLDGRSVIRYDSEAFRASQAHSQAFGPELWGPLEVTRFVDCAFHIYAIDTQGQVIIEEKPVSPLELFSLSRLNKVTHAHLVSHLGLAVLCAGEVVFVQGQGDSRYAIVNNRSGHFLPDSTNLQYAVDSIAMSLQERRENIFELCMARS